MLSGYFTHERRVMFENSVSKRMVHITAILPGSNGRCFWKEAMRCVFYVFRESRIRGHVDDMKLSQKGISCDFPERTRNLYEMLKVEMGKVLLELLVTQGGKEGEGTLELSNPYLRQEL